MVQVAVLVSLRFLMDLVRGSVADLRMGSEGLFAGSSRLAKPLVNIHLRELWMASWFDCSQCLTHDCFSSGRVDSRLTSSFSQAELNGICCGIDRITNRQINSPDRPTGRQS